MRYREGFVRFLSIILWYASNDFFLTNQLLNNRESGVGIYVGDIDPRPVNIVPGQQSTGIVAKLSP